MLKRSAALMLILLYFSTVSGFALNLHYCFNRLSSIKIDAPAANCSKATALCKMKCCTDKKIEIKVKDAHEAGVKSSISKIFNERLLFILVDGGFFGFSSDHPAPVTYRGPPGLLCKAPIYLSNRIFRI